MEGPFRRIHQNCRYARKPALSALTMSFDLEHRRSMENSRVERSKLPVDFAPEGVPYAAILPPGYEQSAPMALCLVLHGGGGSHQNLVDSKPLYDDLWASGAMPPMVLA